MLNLKDKIVCIVASDYYKDLNEITLDNSVKALLKYGFEANNIKIKKVAGSFEIPIVLKNALSFYKPCFAVCFGVIMKGETDHHKYLSYSLSNMVQKISLDENVPVAFGVITVNSVAQALDRVCGKAGNIAVDCIKAGFSTFKILNDIKK